MRINYINEGYFKNPAQLKAEKDKPSSAADKLVSTATNILKTEVHKALNEYWPVINFCINQYMRKANSYYSSSNLSSNFMTASSYSEENLIDEQIRKLFPEGEQLPPVLRKFYSKMTYRALSDYIETKNALKLVIDNVDNYLVQFLYGIWKGEKLHYTSCKRIMFLEYINKTTWNIEDCNWLYVNFGPSGITVDIYALVTGYDKDNYDEHLKIVTGMLAENGQSNSKIDNYFKNIVSEIIDINKMKSDIKVVAKNIHDILVGLFEDFKYNGNTVNTAIIDKLFAVTINVNIIRTHLTTDAHGGVDECIEDNSPREELEKNIIMTISGNSN